MSDTTLHTNTEKEKYDPLVLKIIFYYYCTIFSNM